MDDTSKGPERPTFHDASDAAQLLGVTRSWLIEKAKAGVIPALKVNQHYRFHVPTLEQALLQRQRETIQERPAGAEEASR
ncbi:MAG: helix-turn-helix domain-containing protein [Phycisphaeraceae bacterium]|nr:helix-turn-helix domain-containing protein [Phycisphaeraceae bacterium]